MSKLVKGLLILVVMSIFIVSLSFAGGKQETTGGVEKNISYITAHGGYAEWENIAQALDEYQKEVNPNFNIDRQNIPDRPAYLQKIQTLIAADAAPDWFDLDATPYAEKLAAEGLLVDIESMLKEFNYYDKFVKPALDYQRLENGDMYMLPLTYNIEMFWFNTEILGRYGLKAPETFDDFMNVCSVLKDNGEIPIALAGREGWPIIRYISFHPFRIAGNKYLEDLKRGKASMFDPPGMAGINFVADLGTNGYFQEGFSTADYGSAKDLFLAGKAAMWYIGTWDLAALLDENLPENMKGKVDYFQIPGIENAATGPHDHFAHSGIGLALNAEKFDDTLKDFLKFMLPKYIDRAADFGYFPPGKFTVPADASDLYKRVADDMLKVGQYAMVWDVKLDPVTTDLLASELNALAQGIVSPEEFAATIDASIKENAPKFFK